MSKRKVPSDDELRRLYVDERLSSGMIGERYGCARGSVCKHLRRLGITRPQEGINSRNRNFHKKQFKNGYPVTFLPDHPRASSIGYVFDHVLEIEKSIDRCPTRKEPIHHIDFNRSNSDIDNLVLCSSHRDHGMIHSSADFVLAELFSRGMVGFNRDLRKYFIESSRLAG